MITSLRATAPRLLRRLLLGLVLTVGVVLCAPLTATAQSPSAIADEVERSGFYVDGGPEADLAAAIDRANDLGVAFVRLEETGGSDAAARVAGDVWDELDSRGSRYTLVVVLIDDGYFVQAPIGFDADTLEEADLAALSGFSTDNDAEGLDAFTSTISAGISATTRTTTGGTSGGAASDSSGGIGFGSVLLGILVLGGGFLLFRGWSGKRKAEEAMRSELEADRAEIKEQLRDNADRVIDLGDRVVLSENQELITAYEQASQAYQQVSHEIDGAATAAEVDALDDRIDHAEWQLEMIEAKLEGRPVPPSPAEVEADEARQAEREAARKQVENDKPALGRDESVFAPGPRAPAPPRRTSYPAGHGRRRGGFGGGLGGILGSIVLGQMNRPRSRRTQRRSGSVGGGSLGGGVLRPGGSSRSSRRRGSGRSFGGSGRSRGSGRSF